MSGSSDSIAGAVVDGNIDVVGGGTVDEVDKVDEVLSKVVEVEDHWSVPGSSAILVVVGTGSSDDDGSGVVICSGEERSVSEGVGEAPEQPNRVSATTERKTTPQ